MIDSPLELAIAVPTLPLPPLICCRLIGWVTWLSRSARTAIFSVTDGKGGLELLVPPSISSSETPVGMSERTNVPWGLVRTLIFVPARRTVTLLRATGLLLAEPVDWTMPLIDVLTRKTLLLRASELLVWTTTWPDSAPKGTITVSSLAVAATMRAWAEPKRTVFSLAVAEKPEPLIVIVSPARTGLWALNPLTERFVLAVPARLIEIALEETPSTTRVTSMMPLPRRETGSLMLTWSSPVKLGAGPAYSTPLTIPPMTAEISAVAAFRIPVP